MPSRYFVDHELQEITYIPTEFTESWGNYAQCVFYMPCVGLSRGRHKNTFADPFLEVVLEEWDLITKVGKHNDTLKHLVFYNDHAKKYESDERYPDGTGPFYELFTGKSSIYQPFEAAKLMVDFDVWEAAAKKLGDSDFYDWYREARRIFHALRGDVIREVDFSDD
jgi:hypothetical protein